MRFQKSICKTLFSLLGISLSALLFSNCSVDVNGNIRDDLIELTSTEYFFYSDNPNNHNSNELTKFSKKYGLSSTVYESNLPQLKAADYGYTNDYKMYGWAYYRDVKTSSTERPSSFYTYPYYGCNYTNIELIKSFSVNTNSAELFAVWDLKNTTVHFMITENDPHTAISIYATQTISEDKVGEAYRNGYSFEGWYWDKNYEKPFDFDTPISADSDDIYIYAKWSLITYNITYELAEGEWKAESWPTTFTVESPVTLPGASSVYREGYSFMGWYTDQDGGGIKITGLPQSPLDSGETYNCYSDITVYAQWQIITYSIKFYVDGALYMDPVYYEYNSLVTNPEAPYKEAYNFVAWCTDSSLQTEYDFSSPIKKDLTLYAKFEAIEYKVNYILGEDATWAVDESEITKTFSAEASLTLPDASKIKKEGYTFNGWYYGIDENGIALEPHYTRLPNNYDGMLYYTDIDAYAAWSVRFYTVEFITRVYDDGYEENYTTCSVKYNTPVSDPGYSYRSGYNFEGWYTDTSYTEEYDFSTPVKQNITLYAKYTPIVYTIEYVLGDESDVKWKIDDYPTTFTIEQIVTLPTSAALESTAGNIFMGWYYNTEYQDRVSNLYNMCLADGQTILYLYAKWHTPETVYYVSSLTGKDDNNGTKAYPFKTLERALSYMNELNRSGEDHIINIMDSVTGNYTIDNIIGTELTIQGVTEPSSLNNLTITESIIGNSSANAPVLTITTSIPVYITYLNIKNGSGTNGGGLYIGPDAKVKLNTYTSIDNNTATNGAGIYNEGVLTMVQNVFVSYNTASSKGGGIYNTSTGNTTLENYPQIFQNKATSDGGGIYNEGILNANSHNISENTSISGSGGGIYNCGSLDLNNGYMYSNQAKNGGAIMISASATSTLLNSSDISSNTASANGGGIYVESGAIVTAYDINLNGNTATNHGNGVYDAGQLTVGRSFYGNIDTDQNIHITKNNMLYIGDDLQTEPAFRIDPEVHQTGLQVVDGNVSTNYSHIWVSDDSTGTSWALAQDGTLYLNPKIRDFTVTFKTDYTDITVTQSEEDGYYIFTAQTGLTSYAWSIDGTSKGTDNVLKIELSDYAAGVYDIVLNASDGTTNYSFYGQLEIK
ncbi:MAG: InlB B-repeat-containing protein [Treponema sp.]|nr:InlB B-repeat-containing protein [Treponema sp.]